MADPPHIPETDDAGVGPDREATTGIPRWVKVFLIIAIALVLALVVSRFLGVQHGPSRHGGLGGYTPPMEQRVG